MQPLGRNGLVALALFAALLFGLLSSVRLTGQGLYFDELHQATDALSYLDGDRDNVGLFGAVSIFGIPVLNMTYNGAIKSAIYGLYLRASGHGFSVLSWRLLGILQVSAGILTLFATLAGKLTAGWALIFLGLLLTDATVILTARHDWGPVALALLLRLAFIGVWLRSTLDEDCPPSSTLLLTLIAAVAVFEKVSNVMLVIPLLVAFIGDARRRTPSHYRAALLGGVVGTMPLLLVNLYTEVVARRLISFEMRGAAPDLALTTTLRFAGNYFALGQGALARSFILGLPPGSDSPEAFLIIGLLVLCGVLIYHYRRQNAYLRFAGMALLSYLAIGVALRFMPQPNFIHHWVMGTPFQYAAIASTAVGAREVAGPTRERWARAGLITLFAVFMVYRLFGLFHLEIAFAQGRASAHFDPALTELGEFAAARADEAVFVAADWGLAAQIVALSQGTPGLVREVYWEYDGPADIERIADAGGKRVMYVLARIPRSGVAPEQTARIWQDIGALPGWQEMPAEPGTQHWKTIEIRKFVRVD